MEHNTDLKFFMIESHRPINLYNVFSDVQIFDDGKLGQALQGWRNSHLGGDGRCPCDNS